jgi:hypothetical protein
MTARTDDFDIAVVPAELTNVVRRRHGLTHGDLAQRGSRRRPRVGCLAMGAWIEALHA